jgi:hypothetical protein
MTIHEYAKIRNLSLLSFESDGTFFGDWINHVFSHYSNDLNLESIKVIGINHKSKSIVVETSYIELNDSKYILIDERYIDKIVEISKSVVTGWVNLSQVLFPSFNDPNELNTDIIGFDYKKRFNFYGETGLSWNKLDTEDLCLLIQEIIMKFMITHEIHHILLENRIIKVDNSEFNFKDYTDTPSLDEAINYINNSSLFSDRFSSDELLIELLCDKHAINVTWRDVMFSRGECNPLLFTTAITIAFSKMKFDNAYYRKDDSKSNIDILIRDLFSQVLCSDYCDRFILVAFSDLSANDAMENLNKIAPLYEKFILTINDLLLCYYSIICEARNDYNMPIDFEDISMKLSLLNTYKKVGHLYRNEYFQICDTEYISDTLDLFLDLFEVVLKTTPFHKSTFHFGGINTYEEAEKFYEELYSIRKERMVFAHKFSNFGSWFSNK